VGPPENLPEEAPWPGNAESAPVLQEKDDPAKNGGIQQAIIAFLCAAASVACFKTGFLLFLFLFPVGIAAFFCNRKFAWVAAILAVAINAGASFIFNIYFGADPVLLQWNIFYYSAMILVFTWINVPPGRFMMLEQIPYRMAIGACFCILVFLPYFIRMVNDTGMQAVIARQLEALGSIPGNSEGIGQTLEETIAGMASLVIRGGIPLSCLVFWWINRQFALLVSRFFRRSQAGEANKFLNFHAPFFLIWVLSLSLGAVLLGKTVNIGILEIAGWNVLVLSATMFLVQGGAILMHFLLRIPPLPRILINVGIIILFFRPQVNMVMLALIVILGIAENWVPFRAPKQQ